MQPLHAQVVALYHYQHCPDPQLCCVRSGAAGTHSTSQTGCKVWSGHPLPLGNRPWCLPAAPQRLQHLSLCWLPQHTEVKQIELLFKLAGYSFDRCPFQTLCVLTGKMHATFQPPPPARGAVMPLANAYTH